ncbi:MAG: flagellar assembly protein FliX [Rhodospirillaceae bacterium]|nr:flagellar assembly protein FliX [Rhodospirillaceae bacterium]
MKIEPTLPRAGAAVRRTGTAGASGSGFARMLDDPAPAAPVAAGSPLEALDAVLALQEVADPLAGRARARKRGEVLLDRLEEIRLGLLVGAIPRHRLEELGAMVNATRERCDDERLNTVLDEIELRAAVELAKLEAA